MIGHLVSAPLCISAADDHVAVEPLEILNYREERQKILTAMTTTGKRLRWRQEFARASDAVELLAATCDVLHFTGHGRPDRVIFEEDSGRAKDVDREQLAALLQNMVPPKLVFVSACYSESVADVFIGAGIRHVIAVNKAEAVLDAVALDFAETFYKMLITGDTVLRSFNLAKARVHFQKPNSSEYVKFKLLPEEDNHEVVIFEALEDGPVIKENRRPIMVRNLTPPCSDFLGRNLIVQRIYACLERGAQHVPHVTIVGQKHAGKSQIARAVAQYAAERFEVSNVFYVDCRAHFASDDEAHRVFGAALGLGDCDTREVFVQNLTAEAGEFTNLLLILDNVDEWIAQEGPHRATFYGLQWALSEVSNLTLLVTGEKNPQHVESGRIFEVGPLTVEDAGRLFLRCMPREPRREEIWPDRVEMDLAGSSAHLALSQKSYIRATEGDPMLVRELAALCTDSVNLSADEEMLLEKVSSLRERLAHPRWDMRVNSGHTSRGARSANGEPRASPLSTPSGSHRPLAPAVAGRMSDEAPDPYRRADADESPGYVHWRRLCAELDAEVQGRLLSERGLTHEMCEFLRVGGKWNGFAPNRDESPVDVRGWDSFWYWMDRYIFLLKSCGIWDMRSPDGEYLIQPFRSSADAAQVLRERSRGAGDVVIRFSTSMPRNFVLMFFPDAARATVQEVPVRIERDGHAVAPLKSPRSGQVREVQFESFAELVIQTPEVLSISGVDKEVIFGAAAGGR